MALNEFGHFCVSFGYRVFDRLVTLCVLLITVINSHALGGWLKLVIAADIRIADALCEDLVAEPDSAWPDLVGPCSD